MPLGDISALRRQQHHGHCCSQAIIDEISPTLLNAMTAVTAAIATATARSQSCSHPKQQQHHSHQQQQQQLLRYVTSITYTHLHYCTLLRVFICNF
jgi:hypothetical protein